MFNANDDHHHVSNVLYSVLNVTMCVSNVLYSVLNVTMCVSNVLYSVLDVTMCGQYSVLNVTVYQVVYILYSM